jgi:hypothetical protein
MVSMGSVCVCVCGVCVVCMVCVYAWEGEKRMCVCRVECVVLVCERRDNRLER